MLSALFTKYDFDDEDWDNVEEYSGKKETYKLKKGLKNG